MIMLPGKPPYSQQGGEDQIENILKMNFSYPLGEKTNKKTPEGPWRYIWSHLPYKIKEAFYKSFRKGEEYSAPGKRLTTADWYDRMEHYLNDALDKMIENDPMSAELFPTRFKRVASLTYISCKLCGKDVVEDMTENGICRDCLSKGEQCHCSRCGKILKYTNRDKYISQEKRHDLCLNCHTYLNQVYSEVYCSECGSLFTITNGEYEFLQQKGFRLPQKCKSCRAASKYAVSHGSSQVAAGGNTEDPDQLITGTGSLISQLLKLSKK